MSLQGNKYLHQILAIACNMWGSTAIASVLHVLLLFSQASRALDFIYFLKDCPAEEECYWKQHYYTAILMCCMEPLPSLSFAQ